MLRKLVSRLITCFVLCIFLANAGRSQEQMVIPGVPPIVVPLCYTEVPGQTISCRAAIQERLLNDPNGEQDPFGVVESCEGDCTFGSVGLGFLCQVHGSFQLEELPNLEQEHKVYEPVSSGGNLVTGPDKQTCIVGRKCHCISDSNHPQGMSCAASLDPSDYQVYLQIDFLVVSTTPCQ